MIASAVNIMEESAKRADPGAVLLKVLRVLLESINPESLFLSKEICETECVLKLVRSGMHFTDI